VLLVVVGIGLVRGRYDGLIRTSSTAPSLHELGVPLPTQRPTIVQFSGQFCGTCEPARALVSRILRDSPDIGQLEVDVAEHMKAVRALDIRRTPTLIIVDRRGVPVHRVSGMPREAELREAVAQLAARR